LLSLRIQETINDSKKAQILRIDYDDAEDLLTSESEDLGGSSDEFPVTSLEPSQYLETLELTRGTESHDWHSSHSPSSSPPHEPQLSPGHEAGGGKTST